MTHVIPLNDLKEHDETTTCKCNPKLEIIENGEIIVIHYAFDNRELIEEINLN